MGGDVLVRMCGYRWKLNPSCLHLAPEEEVPQETPSEEGRGEKGR